jgi:hypothetical protein
MKKIIRYFLEKIRYFSAGLLAVGMFAVIATNINLNKSPKAISRFALVNVEMLAASEIVVPPTPPPTYFQWSMACSTTGLRGGTAIYCSDGGSSTSCTSYYPCYQ